MNKTIIKESIGWAMIAVTLMVMLSFLPNAFLVGVGIGVLVGAVIFGYIALLFWLMDWP